MQAQNDRVTVSAGRRISIARYDGFDIYVSYSRDRQASETEAEAILKTEKMVLMEFNRLVELCEKGKIEGAKAQKGGI